MINFSLFFLTIYAQLLWASPHMDLEKSSSDYTHLLNTLPQDKLTDPDVEEALRLGARLHEWISLINKSRSPSTMIKLSGERTPTTSSIARPNIYNASFIRTQTLAHLSQLPSEMKRTLLSSAPLTSSLQLDDSTFINHARLIDKDYQIAARFKLLYPQRSQLALKSSFDVRGYYYLIQHKITQESLIEVSLIAPETIPALKEALRGICVNNFMNTSAGCAQEVEASFKANRVSELFQGYFPKAQLNWNRFFEIPQKARREDVQRIGSTLVVPFNDPKVPQLLNFLKSNIEEEYQFNEWSLSLKFGDYPVGPRLVFDDETVPHVNRLGGSELIMDSHQDLEEYDTQRAVRHEFGHMLGLPDCYHEFYDVKLEAFVNYSLDPTDLMCSRSGKMNERIYLELQRAYLSF